MLFQVSDTDIINTILDKSPDFIIQVFAVVVGGVIVYVIMKRQIDVGRKQQQEDDKESLKISLKRVQLELYSNAKRLATMRVVCDQSKLSGVSIQSIAATVNFYCNSMSYDAYNDLIRSNLLLKSGLLSNRLKIYEQLYTQNYNINDFFHSYQIFNIESYSPIYNPNWANSEMLNNSMNKLSQKSEDLINEITGTIADVSVAIRELAPNEPDNKKLIRVGIDPPKTEIIK